MSLDSSALDSYREFMGDDADSFIQEIIDTFLATAPQLIRELEEAIQKNDTDLFVRSAHTLKSNAATVGATVLADMAAELEKDGKVTSTAGLASRVTQARQEFEKITPLLGG